MFKVSMPLRLRLSARGKFYTLSWNDFRNWHYLVKNSIKQKYCQQVMFQIPKVKYNKIRLVYKIYKPDNRTKDRDNFIGLQAKFFQDSLVKMGVIKNDTDDYIVSSFQYSGENDKVNPRVEITVIEVK